MSEQDLEQKLFEAHAAGNGAFLAELYAAAARQSEVADRLNEACFRYTQAYVFALENGLQSLASDVREKLRFYGREE